MNISRSTTGCNVIPFEHCWDIADFAMQLQIHNSGDALITQSFGNGEYEFQLQLFPNGKDEEYKEYISVFLTILKCVNRRMKLRVAFEIETLKGILPCTLNRNVVTLNAGGLVTASKFFKLSSLMENPEVNLPNGCLKIKVKINVFENSFTDTVDMGFSRDRGDYVDNHSCRLSLLSTTLEEKSLNYNENTFMDFFDSGNLADVTVHVGSKTFHLHRIILSSRSRYFRAMFKLDTKESAERKVVLDDVDPDVCSHIFRFMYSNNSHALFHIAEEVMKLAARFCMDDLISLCSVHLAKNVDVKNFCEMVEMADSMNIATLFNKCLMFFGDNSNDIRETDEWHDLRKRDPHLATKILEHYVANARNPTCSKRAKIDF